jgi:hypothetical protein
VAQAARLVATAQFGQEDHYGPTIRYDVVLRHEEDVIVGCERNYRGPHKRSSLEIETGALVSQDEAIGRAVLCVGVVITQIEVG